MGTHPIFESDFDCLTENMADANLSDFMSITGCDDANRAKFFLESANNDVNAAVLSFFESGGNDAAIPPATGPSEPEIEPQGRLGQVSVNPSTQGEDNREFYVGGQSSGLGVVKNENEGIEDKNKFITDMFKRAKESGASEERHREKEERFIGTGQKLGGDGVASQPVPGKAPRQQPKDLRLVMWKEGFTIDDEPLRRYDDPANKTFLDEITKGQLPAELRHLGREVNVSMEDRRNDDYEENKPKPVFKSFGGGGNRLGSDDAPSTSATSAAPPSDVPTPTISVDQSQPTTKLRFRLANGKQLVQEFNQSHTVQDLKSFCAGFASGKDFELRAGFPPKPIDLSQSKSLKDASLLNETIIQRLK